jgi:hypothetical protein
LGVHATDDSTASLIFGARLGGGSRGEHSRTEEDKTDDIYQGLSGRSLASRGVYLPPIKLALERALRSITADKLRADLVKLCKDPAFESREVGTPGYELATRWVAGELKAAGVGPCGDIKNGARTYFDAFSWAERFAPFNKTRSENVVGIVRGNGPEPRQAVLVIAHLDNLSAAEKRDYTLREGRTFSKYEGANDNAAAVAAALEVAKAAAAMGGLSRDVVFLFPSAEEDGLKGTEAFVRRPPLPLDRFVGVVNLEMIGQNDVSELLVYGGGTPQKARDNALYRRALKVAEDASITLKEGLANDDGERWYDRSDHAVTARAGIPSIMIHGRTDSGHYHTDQDDLEHLNMAKVETVARLVLRIVCDLANDPAPVEKRGAPDPVLNAYPGEVWP